MKPKVGSLACHQSSSTDLKIYQSIIYSTKKGQLLTMLYMLSPTFYAPYWPPRQSTGAAEKTMNGKLLERQGQRPQQVGSTFWWWSRPPQCLSLFFDVSRRKEPLQLWSSSILNPELIRVYLTPENLESRSFKRNLSMSQKLQTGGPPAEPQSQHLSTSWSPAWWGSPVQQLVLCENWSKRPPMDK